MTEKELEIIGVFLSVIPKLNELEQAKLLAFGEGLAFFKKTEEEKKERESAGSREN